MDKLGISEEALLQWTVEDAVNSEAQSPAVERFPAAEERPLESDARRGITTSEAIEAWREGHFAKQCASLNKYYEHVHDRLFSYPGKQGPIRVPLFVRKEWLNLDRRSLVLAPLRMGEPYTATREEREFLELYHEIRRALDQPKLGEGGRLYQLRRIETDKKHLTLTFAAGKFLETIMCQWHLEHELNLALRKSGKNPNLPVRDKLLRTETDIETFCEKKAIMVGVSNLLLLKCGPRQYKPYIHMRSVDSLVGGTEGLYDTIGTCAFRWRRLPELDFDVKERVMTSIGKELFGQDYLAEPLRGEAGSEPKEKWRTVLEEMEKSGDASFDVTGFFIDLIRWAPQITAVFVVRDISYFQKFHHQFGVSRVHREFEQTEHALRIAPHEIKDVDEWMVNSMLRDPQFAAAGVGFDPLRWTPDGGFAFYQGMRRAVAKKFF